MIYTTECVNLRTGERRLYSLLPDVAVVNAHEQEHGNWNWWAYDYSQAKQTPSGLFWNCGDWTATTMIVEGDD